MLVVEDQMLVSRGSLGCGRRRWQAMLAGVGACVVLGGCGEQVAGDPAIDIVEPSTALQDQWVTVNIRGGPFYLDIKVDFRKAHRSRVNNTFTAWLGDTELMDVEYVDRETLVATLQPGSEVGIKDLTVQDPAGRIGTLRDAFTVLDPACGLPGAPGTSCAGFVALSATADATVRQEQDAQNYGNETALAVQSYRIGASGENHSSLVYFGSSVVPAGTLLQAAYLEMCATAVPSEPRSYRVRPVKQAWSEATVSWANQPTSNASGLVVATPAAVGCMTWDVTTDLQGALDAGEQLFGWIILDSNENSSERHSTLFDAREATSDRGPLLNIYYDPL